MRVMRVLKRMLLVLMFVCMTLKIQLELRILESGRNSGNYSPWWSNETLGHLRAFPKDGFQGNVSLNVQNASDSELNGNGRKNEIHTLTTSHVDLKNRSQVSQAVLLGNSDHSAFNRKILQNETIRHNSLSTKSKITVTESENIHTIPKHPVHYKKGRGSMFARLTIDDGKNVVDTDAIYSSHEEKNILEKTGDMHSVKAVITKSVGQQVKIVKKEQHSKEEQKLVKSDFELTKLTIQGNKENPPNVSESHSGNSKVLPSKTKTSASLSKRIKATVLRGVSHDVDSNEMSLSKEAIANIKQELEEENERQFVYNEDRYGPVLQNSSLLLVQVHKRLENLHYLVQSLNNVQGIKEAVVIFSHDFWDPAINTFVRNITEFRVMQMFYPFSIQLHPLAFPGRDPADCPWNINTKKKKKHCLNENWPDSYGHYREASFTQIKHHWWWKINRVFEGLRVTGNNYTGHVVFLEEDHYVLPDMLHVLALMQRLSPSLCPACKVFALGNYNKLNPHVYKNFVERGDWWVTKYNLGFAMDASVWKSLDKCKTHFCNFDDYNWDWSLTNVVQTCLNPRMSMLATRLSRVLHVGSCGTHIRKKVCDVKGEVHAAVNHISTSKKWLFPDTLALQRGRKNSGKPKKGNGGWGDYRDRQLCHAIGNSTAKENTIIKLQALTSF